MCVDTGVQEFEEWVRARSPHLARSAYLLTGDVQLAEDLVQEALTRVAQRWQRVSRAGPPDAYVRQVLHRLSIDAWRRRRSRPAEVTGMAGVLPELAGPGGDPDARMVLRDALLRLTPRQRAVLVLRFYEDLTEVATADVLGVSPSTVKTTAREALARLRATAPGLLMTLAGEADRET